MPDDEAAGPEVCVLAPWPILTVTIERGGTDNDGIYVHAGGQGFWVARMIANLGGSPILCGPFGGETGVVVRALAEAEGVRLRPVAADGWNGAYVHDRRNGARQVVAEHLSPPLSRHEHDDLYDAALATGLRAGTAVLTGVPTPATLPETFCARLARDLDDNDVAVVADLSGPALAALDGGVAFLKVSHEELISAGYADDNTTAALRRGVRALRDTGARNVVVSRADEPTLALLGERLVEVVAPTFVPLDHHGGGDSMTAALAYAQACGLGEEATVRLAAAAGALNITRHGLGTGTLADIREVARKVEVRAVC